MSTPDSAALVGARLRAVRKMLGLKQDAVADLCGVARAQVSQWERGAQRVPFAASIALKSFSGVTLDFFYAGDFSSLPPNLREPLRQHLAEAMRDLGLG